MEVCEGEIFGIVFYLLLVCLLPRRRFFFVGWCGWWQCSSRSNCRFWIITFPNYFRLTSWIFSIPSDGHAMVIMRHVAVVIGCGEPLRYHHRLPNLLVCREPYLLPIRHLYLLIILLPRQLFVGDPFEFLAWLVILLPCLDPRQFLIRNPNLLLARHPNLLPSLLPCQFLIVDVILLLLCFVYFLVVLDPSQLFARHPNLLFRWNPNLLPCTLLIKVKMSFWWNKLLVTTSPSTQASSSRDRATCTPILRDLCLRTFLQEFLS